MCEQAGISYRSPSPSLEHYVSLCTEVCPFLPRSSLLAPNYPLSDFMGKAAHDFYSFATHGDGTASLIVRLLVSLPSIDVVRRCA